MINKQKHALLKKRGFTLIEILLAIGILAILATVAIIAINPARQFAQARNTQRQDDVNKIMHAVFQYTVSHKGNFPSELPTGGTMLEICQTGAPSCTGMVNLASLSENATFLPEAPIDPMCPDECNENGTGYYITIDQYDRVTIQAANAELDEEIGLTQ